MNGQNKAANYILYQATGKNTYEYSLDNIHLI